MPEHVVAPDSGGTPEVTVVVPVYNGATTIADCVSSLLAVCFPRARVEVIVVDNGSTDATCETLAAFDGEIRVLAEPARGASAARNRGIREARGRLIAFIDADSVVEPGWLAALVAPLGDPSVGIVGGRILSRVGGNRIERFGEVVHDQRSAIEEEDPPYVATGNWASRADVLREAGLFDESLLRAQDVDLAWRIHRSGYRLVYAPDAIVRHGNEDTIWGLMYEGYVHGLHGLRLREKHVHLQPGAVARRMPIRARLLADLRRLAWGHDRGKGLLQFLFDTGKAAGELVALTRGTRR